MNRRSNDLICVSCGSRFSGGNAARYCSDECAMKIVARRLVETAKADGDCLVRPSYGPRALYPVVEFRGKTWKVHRLVWWAKRGPIPSGIQIRHSCDRPQCCNVDHMSLGTALDNSNDKLAKQRQTRGRAHWSNKLSEDDVRMVRASPKRHSELARQLGVSAEAIIRIRQRKCWRHVE